MFCILSCLKKCFTVIIKIIFNVLYFELFVSIFILKIEKLREKEKKRKGVLSIKACYTVIEFAPI